MWDFIQDTFLSIKQQICTCQDRNRASPGALASFSQVSWRMKGQKESCALTQDADQEPGEVFQFPVAQPGFLIICFCPTCLLSDWLEHRAHPQGTRSPQPKYGTAKAKTLAEQKESQQRHSFHASDSPLSDTLGSSAGPTFLHVVPSPGPLLHRQWSSKQQKLHHPGVGDKSRIPRCAQEELTLPSCSND